MRCGLGSVRSRLLVGKALSLLLPVAAQTPTAVRLQDVQANMKTATNVVYIVFGFLVVNVFFLNLLIREESGALMKQLGVIFNGIIALLTFVSCVATGGCATAFLSLHVAAFPRCELLVLICLRLLTKLLRSQAS